MRALLAFCLAVPVAVQAAEVTAPATEFVQPERYEANPAGAATVAATVTGTGFRAPAANLPPSLRMGFTLGEALFDKLWVPAPSSTRASDGLGPLFNARACANCHPGNARGRPEDGQGISGMVLKLSRRFPPGDGAEGIDGWHGMIADPAFGWQLQDRALPSLEPEGQLVLDWIEEGDLRHPEARHGFAPETLVSLRVAPQIIGLGLLEAIPEADILAHADPGDADGDGISGRAQYAIGPDGVVRLGRFGHKAGMGRLVDMTAQAFSQDMGLSSVLFPAGAGDCTLAQTDCLSVPDGIDEGLRDNAEVSTEALEAVTAYVTGLGVPKRRDVGAPDVLAGKQAFYEAQCIACHVPKFITATSDNPVTSRQLVWPYTDLLLHDMGEGLADHRPEGVATAAEWRTAPLWGIGLTGENSGHAPRYLHDGRAATLDEAIRWHGGEAGPARDRYLALPAKTRADLIRFLETL
ncbi:di-heme oxidoredictase family protein [Thioclava sp. 'Guangxiensis']|uniref:di-heme oxidoreductase family protein n=1 Tax=Thioclava sp. 'Guangxiensis' TaxID=3149044 RepID=UPI003877AC7C